MIDLTREPGLRIDIRRSATRSRVLALFHHAATDGTGALLFLFDVFARYSRLFSDDPRRVLSIPAVDASLLRRRGHLPITPHYDEIGWLRFRLMMLRMLWQDNFAPVAPLAIPTHADRPGSPLGETGVVTTTLDGAVHLALRRLARRRGVTVNDLLVAEMLRYVTDWNARHGQQSSDRYSLVTVPTNLRRLEHDRMPACNVLGLALARRSARDCADRDALLDSVHQELSFKHRWRVPALLMKAIGLSSLVPGMMDWSARSKSCWSTVILSNLGDPSRLVPGHFPLDEHGWPYMGNVTLKSLVAAPPTIRGTLASFLVWHFNGQFRVSVRCQRDAFTGEQARQLLNGYADRIRALALAPEAGALPAGVPPGSSGKSAA